MRRKLYMVKIEKYESDIQKAKERLEKLEIAKQKEEEKVFQQLGKNYVAIRKLENPEMSYDEIIEFQKMELAEARERIKVKTKNEKIDGGTDEKMNDLSEQRCADVNFDSKDEFNNEDSLSNGFENLNES